MLVPTKAGHITEERSYKWDTVGIKGAGSIDIILALLEDLLVGLRVWDDWFEPGGMNSCRTCHRPKVFLGTLGGSFGGDWTLRIAWYKFPYSEESPRASGSLYPNGSVTRRFCEGKSLVPSRSGVWQSN